MNQPVLVLNANFEPLNVCNTRRAIGLILSGKAEMVANGRGHIFTPRFRYPRPSVIRLDYMIRRPRARVKLTKREVFRRDNFTCQYCGRQSGHLTIDHLVPRHRGGGHAWSNLVTACPPCNRRKGGRTLPESRMSLQRHPSEPPASAAYLFGRYLTDNQDWAEYIHGW